jgi:hypothetical protein
MYAQKEKRQRSMTVNELEMTELLLGDVTMQKDRITEEHDLMSRAWVINEDDLVMSDVIGMGGMGVSTPPPPHPPTHALCHICVSLAFMMR